MSAIDSPFPTDAPFPPPPLDTPATLPAPHVDAAGVRTHPEVVFATTLGYRPVAMDILIPRSGTVAVPVVVWIHGGAFMLGSRRRNRVSSPAWDALLERGVAVASVDYRLSEEARFPACLHDVKAAVRWLRRHGGELGLDIDRIGCWGESAGGHLSAFLGLNSAAEDLNGTVGLTGESADVAAAVAWYPPTDLLHMQAQSGEAGVHSHDSPGSPESLLVGGPLQERQEAAAFASPITHVTPSAAPMLLMHGTEDGNVPYQQSVVLHEALLAAGADATLELVPDARHVFANVDRAPLIARSVEFLIAHLG